MFRLKSKVKILSSNKINGAFNYGVIVGVELMENAYYLTYKNEKEFVARHNTPIYRVAYIDCVTKRGCSEWFDEKELEAKSKDN